jgi:ubiquitin-protein ligase
MALQKLYPQTTLFRKTE